MRAAPAFPMAVDLLGRRIFLGLDERQHQFVAAHNERSAVTLGWFGYNGSGLPGLASLLRFTEDGSNTFQDMVDGGDGRFEDMFFLEVDRSTDELTTLMQRAVCYRDFYKRGGLASRFGRPRSEFKKFPFVVLMTFQNAERRNNTAERLLLSRSPIGNQVWLSTLKEVTTDPLGSIWVKPGDYLKLTEGTAFDVESRQHSTSYRRQPEREEFVERCIPKQPLLASIPKGAIHVVHV